MGDESREIVVEEKDGDTEKGKQRVRQFTKAGRKLREKLGKLGETLGEPGAPITKSPLRWE